MKIKLKHDINTMFEKVLLESKETKIDGFRDISKEIGRLRRDEDILRTRKSE